MTAEVIPIEEEKRRVCGNLDDGGAGLVVGYYVQDVSETDTYVARCTEVLSAYLTAVSDDTFDRDLMRGRLPEWFVEKCAPDRTLLEALAYREWWDALSPQDREAEFQHPQQWSLKNWIYSMDEGRRNWRWHSAHWDKQSAQLIIRVSVDGHPFGDGTLMWLLRACGSAKVVCADVVAFELPFETF